MDPDGNSLKPPTLFLFMGLNFILDFAITTLLRFVQNNKLNGIEITGQQQKELFKISYGRQEAVANRVTTKYYKTNWNSLKPQIKEILTDLKYRGDLRPTSSSAVQKALKTAVKENNLQKFKQVMPAFNF